MGRRPWAGPVTRVVTWPPGVPWSQCDTMWTIAVPSSPVAAWITTASGCGDGRPASPRPPHELPPPFARRTVMHPCPGPLAPPLDWLLPDFTVYSTLFGPTSVTDRVAVPAGPL